MKIFSSQKNKIIVTSIFFASLLFLSSIAQAEEKNSGPIISIAPHNFDLTVFPGEEVKDKIKIYNQGDIAIPFRLKLVGFDAKEETGDMLLNDLEGENSALASWIEFDKEEFIIDPKQKETVNFSLKIPTEAQEQGYYFAVLFQADISTYYFEESRVQIIPNLAVLYMLKVGEFDSDIEPLSVLDYSVRDEDRFSEAEKIMGFLSGPFSNEDAMFALVKTNNPTFVVKLKNNSPYHTKLIGNIDLSGFGWKVKNQLELPALTILPGKTRSLLVSAGDEKNSTNTGLEKVLGFGVVRAGLELETQTGFQKKENRWAIVFSWKLIGLLVFFIVLFWGRGEIQKLLKIIFRKKKTPVDNFSQKSH